MADVSPEELRAISEQIKDDIDSAIVAAHIDGPRKHLGASVIGHECKAHLWFSFRWALTGESFNGRMLRLFNRGHLEEFRLVGWLKQAGWVVQEYDPVASAAAGKDVQWRFSACDGHFGGSSDGKVYHEKYDYLGLMLSEFKTHNTKQFTNLASKGVALTMPKHVAQMNTYAYAFGHDFGLYFPINKNDDDIKPEVIKLDKRSGEANVQKAEEIITAQVRPAKVSPVETYFACKWCQYVGVCHRGEQLHKNCRSCKFAVPSANATWTCTNFGGTIPEDFIIKGCEEWTQLEH